MPPPGLKVYNAERSAWCSYLTSKLPREAQEYRVISFRMQTDPKDYAISKHFDCISKIKSFDCDERGVVLVSVYCRRR